MNLANGQRLIKVFPYKSLYFNVSPLKATIILSKFYLHYMVYCTFPMNKPVIE